MVTCGGLSKQHERISRIAVISIDSGVVYAVKCIRNVPKCIGTGIESKSPSDAWFECVPCGYGLCLRLDVLFECFHMIYVLENK